MTNATLKNLLRLLPELYQHQATDTFASHVLQVLARLVPSDISAYNEVNPNPSRIKFASRPDSVSSSLSRYLKQLEMFISDHPVVRHQRKTGDLSARKISDFLSRKDFHRSALYQEVYRHLDGEDQMAVGLEIAGKAIVALAMNRSRRSFTENERDLLNALQPHLVQAYRTACLLSRVQNQLVATHNLLESLPAPLAILNRRLQLKACTRSARALLARYFNHSSSGTLPAPLRTWLAQKRQWLGQPLPSPTADFVQDKDGATLLVRYAGGGPDGEIILGLEERRSPDSALPLRSLGLTSREAEILLWVARGKSNPEIGTILGAAPRTVQKHMEHILEKLGVTSRTEAARRALEAFSPGLSRL
jgi:DNA-binding CsgD family transcriptional regulator